MLLDKKNFNLLNIADYISALPVAFSFYMFFNLVRYKNRFFTLGFVGLLVSSVSADFLKRLPYPKKWEFFTLRPNGANNWDILSRNDYSNKINPPGFPSGHMSTVSFFSSYIMMASETTRFEKVVLFALIFLTAWARWFKGVHNIPQILAGTSLGILIAFIFSKFL